MRIHLHIGLEHVGADRLQAVLAKKRDQLASKGYLLPQSLGGKNHTRLFMAITDPDHVDPLRFNRGHFSAEKQAGLYKIIAGDLAREIESKRPTDLIVTASQLGASLHRVSELERLKALLGQFSADIRLVAHVDEPARLLARHYAQQVFEGRSTTLTEELALCEAEDWWSACLARAPKIDPEVGLFVESQTPPFWLDYAGLIRFWESVFGAGTVTLRSYDAARFAAENVTEELRATFNIDATIGKAGSSEIADQPAAAWLTRGRRLNALLLQILQDRTRFISRRQWRGFIGDLEVSGAPIDAGSLFPISKRFEAQNAALAQAHPALQPETFTPPPQVPLWEEADPAFGFRATQYLVGFMPKIKEVAPQEPPAAPAPPEPRPDPVSDVADKPDASADGLSESARALLPPLAVQKFQTLRNSRFAPHNNIGAVDETAQAPAYTAVPKRTLPVGNSGNVIIGCMKNEAPYILEWIAYHRAIGVDNFLIYSNDCSDGTAEILDRLQSMGIVEHRNNDVWKGKSPQQYALNQALKEPIVKQAEWLIHIDIDEYINVRIGNGTLADVFELAPDATNIAMTWRLFGHNNVLRLRDDFVIDQFETCAPKYCPKPHTVWGFKTMLRNIGAYQKLSCHRPNKLDKSFEAQVKWINGSGKDMTREAIEKGWRSSKKSIGYDVIQLNHYALRSAESFLVKRQRGRALHVDRSIGLNYWIRMDWSDVQDITIKRNLPRLRAEYDQLLQDKALRDLHAAGFAWHEAKAAELHTMPEFEELYTQALSVKLTGMERVAYALALDLES